MRGRALGLLAAALGIAGASWFLARKPEPAPPPPPPPAPAKSVPVPAPPVPPVAVTATEVVAEEGGATWTGPCTLRGRATRTDGTPWVGLIGLYARFSDGVPPPPTRTADDGTFRIENLPAMEVRLVARESDDLRLAGPIVLLPCEEEVPFVVGAGIVDIEGRVVAAVGGAPVAGATVTIEGPHGDESFWGKTTSDAEGRFRLHRLNAEDCILYVNADGFSGEHVDLAADRAPGEAPIDVRLRRPGSIEVRVLEDGTGKPVAGVHVHFAADSGYYTYVQKSDEDGRCVRSDLRPGDVLVYVMDFDWVSKEFAAAGGWDKGSSIVVVPEDATVKRDLVVVPAPRIRGRVVDADGKGVPDLLVAGSRHVPEEDRSEWEHTGIGDLVNQGTSAEGTFEFPFLLPGVVTRLTVQRGQMPLLYRDVAALAPGAVADLVLQVPRERCLEVRVLDAETGRPLPDMDVTVHVDLLPGNSETLGWWLTGLDGTANLGPIPALPMSVGVDAVEHRHEASERKVIAVDEAGPVELRVRLVTEPADLVIEGTVLLPDGTPAAGAEWECWATADDGSTHCFSSLPSTDFRGRFRAEDLAKGRHRVKATFQRDGRSYRGGGVFEAGTKGAVIRIEEGALIDAGLIGDNPLRFRVLGPDGKAVPRAEVRIHFLTADDSENSEEAQLHEGICAFALPQRKCERMWIEVSDACDAAKSPLPYAHSLVGPLPVTPGQRDIPIGPETAIEGRVVDNEGRGIAAVNVSVRLAPGATPGMGNWSTASSGILRTDSEGRFRIGSLGGFSYLLDVEPNLKYARPAPMPVRGGARDVLVALRSAVSPVITVLGPDGKPVADAWVYSHVVPYSDRANEPSGRTGPTGFVCLAGLDPELTYSLNVDPPEDRGDLLPWEAESWEPVETTVQLKRGFPFQVLVKDKAGRPVKGIEVSLSPDTGRGMQETSDAEGVARFRWVPAGSVTVEAFFTPHGGGPRVASSATAPADSGKASLVLDVGAEVVLLMKGWQDDWVGSVHIARDEDPEPVTAMVDDEGTVRLRGLLPGNSYNVYVQVWEAGDRYPGYALVRGVRAGEAPREVPIVEGKEITGKAVLPAGADGFSVAVLVGKTVLIDGEPAEDGTFRIPAVPEGTWTVVVYLTTPDRKYHSATGTAAAGGTVEIRVP